MNQITTAASDLVGQVCEKSPLVHNITNYVTVNDVANSLLAIGASPIMADDIAEAADIASISSAVVLNIGTLNQRTVQSMVAAGEKANDLGIPVVLDPVGAGASTLRNDVTKELLSKVKFSVLRGNLSEISFVAGLSVSTKGVDASAEDARHDAVLVAKDVARKYDCVAAITGPVDVISDGERVVKIKNGHPMLSRVTGTGCMTSALVGAFVGTRGDRLAAAVGAVACMGIAGEMAYETAEQLGTGSFRTAIIDSLSKMTPALFAERAKLDEE